MISIMKYFDQARSGIPIEELLDINRRLVRAIGEHAVKADPPGYDRFRAEIARIETELGEASSLSALQGASNSAVKVMEDYNRSAGESMHARAQEMQQMVSMLTGAVEKLANGCERSVANLRAIEKQIEQASAVEDIRVLRGKLTQCVGELRLEAARQREESGRVMADVKKELKRSASASDGQLGPNGLDRVTGLPGKSAAQQAFEAAIASEGEFCVAAFVFPRIRLIKSRFGAAVGDKIVSSFASHLRGSLFIEGQCFRWDPLTIVTVFEGTEATPRVQSEIRRVALARQNEIIDTGQRTVLLPVNASWTLFAGSDVRSLPDLVEKVELFVAAQTMDGALSAGSQMRPSIDQEQRARPLAFRPA